MNNYYIIGILYNNIRREDLAVRCEREHAVLRVLQLLFIIYCIVSNTYIYIYIYHCYIYSSVCVYNIYIYIYICVYIYIYIL